VKLRGRSSLGQTESLCGHILHDLKEMSMLCCRDSEPVVLSGANDAILSGFDVDLLGVVRTHDRKLVLQCQDYALVAAPVDL